MFTPLCGMLEPIVFILGHTLELDLRTSPKVTWALDLQHCARVTLYVLHALPLHFRKFPYVRCMLKSATTCPFPCQSTPYLK
jgi:hypothetical protein